MLDTNKRRLYNSITVIGIFALVLFQLYRARLGLIADEVYIASISDMLSHDRLFFKECWTPLQIGSFMEIPFICIYRFCNGSADGIMLFLRIVAIFIHLGITIYFFITLSDYKTIDRKNVLVASIVFLTFSADYNSFGYKQQMIWFLMLSVIFCYKYITTDKSIYGLLNSLSTTCLILSYQTCGIVLILYLISWMLWRKKMSAKGVILFVLSFLAEWIAILLFIIHQMGIQGLIYYIPMMFYDKNLELDILSKLIHPITKMLFIAFTVFILLIVNEKIDTRKEKLYHLPICTILLAFAYLGWIYVERENITWHIQTYPYSVCIGIILYLYYRRKNKEKNCNQYTIYFLLFCATLTAFFAATIASNQGNITSMYGSVFSAICLILILGDTNLNCNPGQLINYERNTIIWTLLGISIVTLLLVYEAESVRPDLYNTRTIFSQRVENLEGPTKGIYLGIDTNDRVTEIYNAIDEGLNGNERLLIIDEDIPAMCGYMKHNGINAAYAPGGKDFDMLMSFYYDNPRLIPDCVLLNKEYLCENDAIGIEIWCKNQGYSCFWSNDIYLLLKK